MIVKDFFYSYFAPKLWWAQYFNGQVKRTEFIASCLREIAFTNVIETGTFMGNSSIALASLSNCKVHTVEVNQKYFNSAEKRIKLHHEGLNIQQYLGSSEQVLEGILRTMSPQFDTLFLYLDAHWGKHLPLNSEISILNSWGGKFIALIDDFQILDDNGYGFDKYENFVIGKDLVPLTKSTKLFRLAAPSSLETGSKRGTGIVIHVDLFERFSPSLSSMVLEI